VTESRGRISLEVSGRLDPTSLTEPLIFSAGARAGIDVVRLQELVAAVEIATRSSSDSAITVVIDFAPDCVTISVRPISRERLEARLFFLRQLVRSVDITDDQATLYVGR
jgi:hypothetical protein